jgi:hypothetical protein
MTEEEPDQIEQALLSAVNASREEYESAPPPAKKPAREKYMQALADFSNYISGPGRGGHCLNPAKTLNSSMPGEQLFYRHHDLLLPDQPSGSERKS